MQNGSCGGAASQNVKNVLTKMRFQFQFLFLWVVPWWGELDLARAPFLTFLYSVGIELRSIMIFKNPAP